MHVIIDREHPESCLSRHGDAAEHTAVGDRGPEFLGRVTCDVDTPPSAFDDARANRSRDRRASDAVRHDLASAGQPSESGADGVHGCR
ncbi:hypothetical protein BJY17_000293 [Agromyces hippuratus]|uniref:Uncharacterized protein n=1 Tax=Agromyces hippuratus TaxID=286438 RepID=A0A852WNK8_9MICO|nr:hypothetical protein [Agromyces hippuratus]